MTAFGIKQHRTIPAKEKDAYRTACITTDPYNCSNIALGWPNRQPMPSCN